jgi:hypothetical protein
MPPSPLQTQFLRDGATLCPNTTTPQILATLALAIQSATASPASSLVPSTFSSTRKSGITYAARNLLTTVPQTLTWATSPSTQSLIHSLIGEYAFPVRAILFDKLPGANWPVGWHQDVVIPVHARIDTPGYGPWSIKAGVVHVRPPVEVLESMIALRLHLDDCPQDNGALKIIPGSHAKMLSDDQVTQRIAQGPIQTIPAKQGEILAMRPLILHSSAPSTNPTRRRVLHIEFATKFLPGGPQWPNLIND